MKKIVLNRWLLELITEYRWGQFPEIPIMYEDGEPGKIENISERLSGGQKEIQWFSVDENGDHWRIRDLNDINETDQYIVRVEVVYISPESKWTNECKTKSISIRIWTNLKKGGYKMKEYKTEELKRTNWEQFLWTCNVSEWEWSSLDDLDIVEEREDYIIAKISISEILDQPDVHYEELEDGTLLVDWGEPVVITNPKDNPDVYLRIWKDPINYLYRCDGQLYISIDDIKD